MATSEDTELDASQQTTPATNQPRLALEAAFLRGLVERYEAAWHAKDADGFLALHTEDCVWEMPLIYPDGVAAGHAGIRAECQRAWAGLPDMRFSTGDLFVSLDGTRAVQLWTGRGTLTGRIDPPGYAPTNQPVEIGLPPTSQHSIGTAQCADQASRLSHAAQASPAGPYRNPKSSTHLPIATSRAT
jgi:ketosteroid isomerase-like protein